MLHCVSIGCKVNQAEIAEIKNKMSDKLNGLNIGVINTCAVTNVSESKSRKLIRRFIRENPDSRLIVTGCFAEAQPDTIRNLLRKDDIVVTNKEKDRIPEILESLALSAPMLYRAEDVTGRPVATSRTRAFMKIQDGCKEFCSYCIVPYVRTEMWSKPPEIVEEEVRRLVSDGYMEIVLCGVNLGAYGNLAGLLERLLRVIGSGRIRLSSIELNDISDELILLIARNTSISPPAPLEAKPGEDNNRSENLTSYSSRLGGTNGLRSPKNLLPHFHIPLQSGSDKILNAMRRNYTSADFINRIGFIKSKIENPSITTDVIVGFPNESDDDFDRTLSVCQKVGFSKIHIFCFSPRKGTLAAEMKDKIKPQVIKNRFQILNNLAQELSLRYKQLFLGKEVDVLVEDFCTGFSERYIKVKIEQDKKGSVLPMRNHIITVKINEVKQECVKGVMVG